MARIALADRAEDLIPGGHGGGERPRRAPQRLAVMLRGSGLVGQHEGRADLGGRRAGRQDGCNAAPARNSTGGHQRQVGRRAYELEQGQKPDVTRSIVVEAGAVPARLDALDDQGVRAGLGGSERQLGRI